MLVLRCHTCTTTAIEDWMCCLVCRIRRHDARDGRRDVFGERGNKCITDQRTGPEASGEPWRQLAGLYVSLPFESTARGGREKV